MALITAALALAVALPLSSQDEAQVPSYKLAGRQVLAVLPDDPGPMSAEQRRIEFGGWRYAVSETGAIVNRYKVDGGWRDVRALRREAQETPVAEWRVKGWIFSDADILDTSPGGLLWTRRSFLEERHVTEALEAFARAALAMEGLSGGRLRVVLDVDFEEERLLSHATAESRPYDAEFFHRLVAPRVNTEHFDAEDKLVRGPYDSVFVIHPGLVDQVRRFDHFGIPGSALPFFSYRRGDLAQALVGEWKGHLAHAMRRRGYSISPELRPGSRFIPPGFVPDDLWASLGNRQPVSTADLNRGLGDVAREVRPRDWSEVRANPTRSLPALQLSDFAPVGAEQLRAALVAPASGTTATARLSHEGRNLLLVRSAYGDLFGSNLRADLQAKVLGRFESGGAQFYVFELATAPPDGPEYRLLDLGGVQALHLDSIGAGAGHVAAPSSFVRTFPRVEDEQLQTRDMPFELASDSESGDLLRVRSARTDYRGSIRLAGYDDRRPLYDAAAAPFFTFSVRGVQAEPMVLRLERADGSSARIGIFGQPMIPSEMPPGIAGQVEGYVAVPANGEWQTATVDLRQLSPATAGPVVAVYLERHPLSMLSGLTLTGPQTVEVRELSAAGEAPGAAATLEKARQFTADASSGEPVERALAAARLTMESGVEERKAVVALLDDDSPLVRLNAAAAFVRVKEPSAEAGLSRAASDLNRHVAIAALRALGFQATPGSRTVIRERLDAMGALDEVRAAAAEALAAQGQGQVAGAVSKLLAAMSWQARIMGANSLAAMPGNESKIMLMAFLRDDTPNSRLNVMRLADPQHPLHASRLQWYAVNDPSDLVRALAFIRMIDSTVPNLREEGYKGVRDTSRATRITIIEHLGQNPAPQHREALRLAATDSNPEVRAAAVRALAAQPGELAFDDIKHLEREEDPRVQAALVDGALKGRFVLPASTVAALTASADPAVAARAREIKR
jgi:HEAT repeat protein